VDGTGENVSEEARASFWKKNAKASQEKPSPKTGPRANRQRNSSSASFEDFQDSVSDAPDTRDDEFCIIYLLSLSLSR
jgi:hypothetical protein